MKGILGVEPSGRIPVHGLRQISVYPLQVILKLPNRTITDHALPYGIMPYHTCLTLTHHAYLGVPNLTIPAVPHLTVPHLTGPYLTVPYRTKTHLPYLTASHLTIRYHTRSHRTCLTVPDDAKS
jgi:hypothetical protein